MNSLKIKRITKWTSENLQKLNNDQFLEIFSKAVSDRTQLTTEFLQIDNPIKHGAPPESFDLLLEEAKRRNIPISEIANKVVSDALLGNSFLSDFLAPKNWKRYEIHAAYYILKMLIEDNAQFDFYKFDARIKGNITGEERQIDLLIQKNRPPHIVACEFRNYPNKTVPISEVEAFATKMKDIEANKGLIVTPTGYQKGAITTANYYSIALFILNEMKGFEIFKRFGKLDLPLDKEKSYWVLENSKGVISVGEGDITEKSIY